MGPSTSWGGSPGGRGRSRAAARARAAATTTTAAAAAVAAAALLIAGACEHAGPGPAAPRRTYPGHEAAFAHARETGESVDPELLFRDDYFRGLQGDAAALERAFEKIERQLQQTPDDAVALVWHGASMMERSRRAFTAGDRDAADESWQRGLAEMDRAVGLRPEVRIRTVRGGTLIGTGCSLPPDHPQRRPMLAKGLGDYEVAIAERRPGFAGMSEHVRGELLGALAEGYRHLGDRERSDATFEWILRELPGSPYAEGARRWLATAESEPLPPSVTCQGCHYSSP